MSLAAPEVMVLQTTSSLGAAARCSVRIFAVRSSRLRHEELLLLRQVQRVAESALRMRDNGDLCDGLGILLLRGDERMADLVVGDDALFLLR